MKDFFFWEIGFGRSSYQGHDKQESLVIYYFMTQSQIYSSLPTLPTHGGGGGAGVRFLTCSPVDYDTSPVSISM